MTIQPKEPKPKKCAHCGEKFTPRRGSIGQKACSPSCALAMAPQGREKAAKALQKAEKVKHREAKERVKTKGEYAREAQQAFNQWIRLRDTDQPCISCGRHHEGQYHAGHYRTVASAPELRFEPMNVHKQCAPCNNHKSGDIVNYRANLLVKIGHFCTEWLEGPHEPKRYTIEDLKAITAEYRAKVRELKVSN